MYYGSGTVALLSTANYYAAVRGRRMSWSPSWNVPIIIMSQSQCPNT